MKVVDLIHLDPYAATPKYLQLANNIIRAVQEGVGKEGNVLPSINELSATFDVSRDTVEKAYRLLKKKGILKSVTGKGYYITNVDTGHEFDILLLFNKLSPQKKIIYESFAGALGDAGTIDLFIYNNDYHYLKKILSKARKDYTHFVIIPQFNDNREGGYELINQLPKNRTILMNHLIPHADESFGAVYENYEEDIFNCLQALNKYIKKYTDIKLVFPGKYYPMAIIKGFVKFCTNNHYNYDVIKNIHHTPLKSGQLYLIVEDDDLVDLSEKILATTYKPGKEIGIISYNENPFKRVILNGITTISTDFEAIGKTAAEMIMNKQPYHKPIAFKVILRDSL